MEKKDKIEGGLAIFKDVEQYTPIPFLFNGNGKSS
jgi:hypothetical protein